MLCDSQAQAAVADTEWTGGAAPVHHEAHPAAAAATAGGGGNRNALTAAAAAVAAGHLQDAAEKCGVLCKFSAASAHQSVAA